jgi:hypothetical protein
MKMKNNITFFLTTFSYSFLRVISSYNAPYYLD